MLFESVFFFERLINFTGNFRLVIKRGLKIPVLNIVLFIGQAYGMHGVQRLKNKLLNWFSNIIR